MNTIGSGPVAGMLVGLAALVGTLPAATQTGARPADGPEPVASVTIEAAVEQALQVNPQMVQAERGVLSAAMGTRQARASFLPTLSVSSGASLSSSERFDPTTNLRVTGQSDSYSAGLSSSMDVFSGGRNLAAVRSANAAEEAAEAGLITRRFAVVVATKRVFFAVLRAEDLIRVNEERIRQAEENLEAAERRLAAGRATRSDLLRAELQLRNARQARLEAETQRRTAMYALGNAVGVTGPVAALRPASLEPAPLALSTDVMRTMVLEEAPTVASARASTAVASAGVAQARAQYYPTVGLRAGYNWSNTELGLDDGRTSWSTSLSLSYPLFNGLQREVNVDRANAQLLVAEAQAADANRTALTEFERLLAALELAEQRVALLRESVEVAEEDYRVQQARYEHGTTTILELVSSQIALVQAETDLVTARYDYQIAKAELESLVGREL
jgi:outer membrane protein